MLIFSLTKHFPSEEKYSMVDQMRRSFRSVCANIGEAWRKRRYPAHFVSKLSDSEAEAEETRVWVELAFRCGYLKQEQADDLDDRYDKVLGQLVRMINTPEKWKLWFENFGDAVLTKVMISPRLPVSPSSCLPVKI